jgi:hypothetical protein
VIIVRSAIKVDPLTTQVSIDSQASDPIPHIIGGIPIHLRDIRVYISRPNFTLNPTNCDSSRSISTLTGSSPPFINTKESTADAVDAFQVSNCSALDFRPRISMKLLGATKRNAYPALRAVVRQRPGDANIGRAAVALPHAEFLAQNHIKTVCTMRQFQANSCPPGSVYGRARAFTPLLSEPLEGPVYLRSGGGHLIPDMVIALHGRDDLEIDLVGRVDSVRGGMRATFEDLPDAPASKFVVKLFGGKRGLLNNSANVCAAAAAGSARFVGQNNTGLGLKPALRNQCGKRTKHHRSRRGHHR